MELVFLDASKDVRVDFITVRILTNCMVDVSPALNRIRLLTDDAYPLILIQFDFFRFIKKLLRHLILLSLSIIIAYSTLIFLFKFLLYRIYCPVLDQHIDFLFV